MRDVETHQVDPSGRLAHRLEARRLDRRVADDLQQLLMRPHVVLERRDVEVAHENRSGRVIGVGADGIHLGDEIELVPEFPVDDRIGLVAAGRDIEIVQQDGRIAGRKAHRKMPAVLDLAEAPALDRLDRPARDRGDAVIALLPVHSDVLVTEPPEGIERKQVVRTLGFLQAQHVRRLFDEQALDDRHSQANGVDVRGGDGQGHGTAGKA